MLELIALYFIYKEAGCLASEKGYSPARWRTRAIITWFLGELTGLFVMMTYFPGQLMVSLIIGISMVYLSYLILKKHWDTLPYNPQNHD